jgi:hypothetical protein
VVAMHDGKLTSMVRIGNELQRPARADLIVRAPATARCAAY